MCKISKDELIKEIRKVYDEDNEKLGLNGTPLTDDELLDYGKIHYEKDAKFDIIAILSMIIALVSLIVSISGFSPIWLIITIGVMVLLILVLVVYLEVEKHISLSRLELIKKIKFINNESKPGNGE